MAPEWQSTDPQQKYREYKVRFAKLSDAELLELRRQGKTDKGWVSTRGAYERALSEEIIARGLKAAIESDDQ